MKPTIFVRSLSEAERQALTAELRSADALTVRRSQILLASARGESVPQIARHLSCNEQTVRNAIQAFHQHGLAALARQSSRPHTSPAAFTPETARQLQALLHRSPRDFGYLTSLWTLDLAAAEAFRQGLTPARVSGETIRATLARLGIRWRRAKQWITSPDPAYARKKSSATA
jgi:transposase